MNDPCDVQGDQALSDQITDRYADRMQTLSESLTAGDMSLATWHQKMEDAIRLAFNHQAVAGTPDNDVRNIVPADRERIQKAIANQYDYLDGFVSDIQKAMTDGSSLDFVANRARKYAASAQSEYWQQAVQVDLPAYPRDGTSECLSGCQCHWNLYCDDKGNVEATWNLGIADHCPTCLQRSAEWAPLIIPKGKQS